MSDFTFDDSIIKKIHSISRTPTKSISPLTSHQENDLSINLGNDFQSADFETTQLAYSSAINFQEEAYSKLSTANNNLLQHLEQRGQNKKEKQEHHSQKQFLEAAVSAAKDEHAHACATTSRLAKDLEQLQNAKQQHTLQLTQSSKEEQKTINKILINQISTFPKFDISSDKDIYTWFKQWLSILDRHTLDIKHKIELTKSKLDDNTLATFNASLTKTDSLWANINKNTSSESTHYRTPSGNIFQVSSNSTYDVNLNTVIGLTLKTILKKQKSSFLNYLENTKLSQNGDVLKHQNKFAANVERLRICQPSIDANRINTLYMRSLPDNWKLNLTDDELQHILDSEISVAFQWARDRADLHSSLSDILTNNSDDTVCPAIENKNLMPSTQTLITKSEKTSQQTWNTATPASVSNLYEAKLRSDKAKRDFAQTNESSDEDESKEDTHKQKKHRKYKKARFITTDEINVIDNSEILDSINALKSEINQQRNTNFHQQAQLRDINNKLISIANTNGINRRPPTTTQTSNRNSFNTSIIKECSYCKHNHKLDARGNKIMANLRPPPPNSYTGHIVTECPKLPRDNRYRNSKAWCGYCPSFQHKFSRCPNRQRTQNHNYNQKNGQRLQ